MTNNIPIAIESMQGGDCGGGGGGCFDPGGMCGLNEVMPAPSSGDPYGPLCFPTPCTSGFCPSDVCINFGL